MLRLQPVSLGSGSNNLFHTCLNVAVLIGVGRRVGVGVGTVSGGFPTSRRVPRRRSPDLSSQGLTADEGGVEGLSK